MKVGDKVVCIDGDFRDLETGEAYVHDPKKDDIMTVDGVKPGFLCFVEIPQIAWDGDRHYYDSNQFRKIDFNFGNEIAESIEEEINEENLVPA